MSRALVFDRCNLVARETCLRLRRRHGLLAEAIHPTDFNLTFDDQGPPALIVTELQMPLFSGLELIRRVRSAHASSVLPIIAYTVVDDALTWEQATLLGADEVVARLDKGAPELLDAAVRRLLHKPLTPAPASGILRLFRTPRFAAPRMAAA